MSRRHAVAVTVTLAAAVCAGAGLGAPRASAPGAQVGPGAPRASAPGAYVTPCSPIITGGLRPGHRRQSLVVGPLVVYPARTWARHPARSMRRASRRRAFLFPADVGVAGRRPVTLAVAAPDRAHASLLFDRARFRADGRYRLADGERSVRFTACPGQDPTRSNGGLLVDGPGCVRLVVRLPDRRSAVRRAVRVGTGGPPCR